MQLLILLCLAALGGATKVSYSGHRLFSVYPTTEEHVRVLESLREGDAFIVDFWSDPHVGHKVDIHVPPAYEEGFLFILDAQGITHEVAVSDIQRVLDVVDAENEEALRRRDASNDSIINTFARTSQMDAFMMELARTYEHVSIFSIGKSFEGREQYVLKYSDGRAGKKSIWVDAGIHAREWLAQSTTIWMMNEIATKYGKDAAVTDLVDRYDWYFMPNLNPDGYEYSHDTDRLWRKTRTPSNSSLCYGTDANRNFDFPVFAGEGTSSDPCSNIYHGQYAYSEPETANLRDFVMSVKDELAMYISVHCCSYVILTNWAYTAERPPDHEEIDRVAKIGADALTAVHGTPFDIGTPPEIMYVASGGSYDWAKGTAGVKYSYTYELRFGELTDESVGFVIAASEIEPSAQELLASIAAMARAIKV